MTTELAKDLKALAFSKDTNALAYAHAALSTEDPFSFLEKFPSPSRPVMNASGATMHVNLRCPEFTSLCPLTGQPDFATIVIDYTPKEWCVESKALKLYLMSFRNRGEFHEACINRIANDLIKLLDPQYMKVVGEFTPRGGIPIWPTVEYLAPSN